MDNDPEGPWRLGYLGNSQYEHGWLGAKREFWASGLALSEHCGAVLCMRAANFPIRQGKENQKEKEGTYPRTVCRS